MTNKQLAAIRAATDAATPGPWKRRKRGKPDLRNQNNLINGPNNELVAYGQLTDEDAIFCAVARTAMPELLDTITKTRSSISAVLVELLKIPGNTPSERIALRACRKQLMKLLVPATAKLAEAKAKPNRRAA